jgi:hypothetical protein
LDDASHTGELCVKELMTAIILATTIIYVVEGVNSKKCCGDFDEADL